MNLRARMVETLAIVFLFLGSAVVMSATEMPIALREQIDAAARATLADTGVPSASVAIVQNGAITYLHAYGDATHRTRRRLPLPAMRYSIGSISKQFTAAAILLLAEHGKLSLDDPGLAFRPQPDARQRSHDSRTALAHFGISGLLAAGLRSADSCCKPVTADKILDLWARKPLDFDPGTEWQYSNTNFVIAGLIVEKASGEPLLQFLSERIFAPLGMKSVINIDQERLTETDATGYLRYAHRSAAAAPKEGKGGCSRPENSPCLPRTWRNGISA